MQTNGFYSAEAHVTLSGCVNSKFVVCTKKIISSVV